MLLPITPVPKPRMTRRDKWKKRPCVLRYRAFCDELRLRLKSVPVPLDITFILEMPSSWSEKKKREMEGSPHCVRGDLDNYLKSFLDGMLTEDSHVYEIHARKIWGRSSGILIHEVLRESP